MENIITDNQPLQESGNDQISLGDDIMKVFDTPEVEEVNDNSINSEPDVEIDDRFKDLEPSEAKYRTIQSKYDKLYNQYQNMVKESEENTVYLQVLNDLMEDDLVFEAFVRERKPELIKETNVTELIQKKLREEFGDVKYTRAEADENPGGRAWLYFKRLDELYSELKGNHPKISRLKEAIEYKRQLKEKESKQRAAELQTEMDKIKKELKWDDNKIVNFTKWINSVKPIELAKIYNFAIRSQKVPSIANANVGNTVTQSLRSKFLQGL